MSLVFIEGGAGTGKTTTLIQRLEGLMAAGPLGKHQRVLALTKMHGSRRRMGERLTGLAGLNGRFECMTLDSFGWRVIRRWRSLARVLAGAMPTAFDEICEQAGRLLEEPRIQSWVASSYPIVVVDELQDSKGGQLRILKGICQKCVCVAAGDPFQELDGDGACASVEWARQQGTPTVLTVTHRTNTPGLLAAAAALREGQAVVGASGFSLTGVDAYGLGAWEAALKIVKWLKLGSIAVISPVTAGRSKFVRQIVERINSGPIGKQQIGPFKLIWEAGHDDQILQTCLQLGLPDEDEAVVNVGALSLTGAPCVRIVVTPFDQRNSDRGLAQQGAGNNPQSDSVQRIVQVEDGSTHGRADGNQRQSALSRGRDRAAHIVEVAARRRG